MSYFALSGVDNPTTLLCSGHRLGADGRVPERPLPAHSRRQPSTRTRSREPTMSYLDRLRLHFAGRFQATVSTVNNDPAHFDNEKFVPAFQTRGRENGWRNPDGDGDWRLLGCQVTSAFSADGAAVPATDPIWHMLIADSDHKAPAKIVDLDPEQQLVSTIFGLEVRIADRSSPTRHLRVDRRRGAAAIRQRHLADPRGHRGPRRRDGHHHLELPVAAGHQRARGQPPRRPLLARAEQSPPRQSRRTLSQPSSRNTD